MCRVVSEWRESKESGRDDFLSPVYAIVLERMSGLLRSPAAASTSAAVRSAACHCSRSSTLSRLIRPTSTSSLGQTRLRSTQAQTPAHTATPTPQRALLYVPGSNQKMLDKMLAPTSASAAATDSTVPDVITLDLEDSVRTEKKAEARRMVTRSVRVCSGTPPRDEC
jgi:hypothetical protein